MKYVLILTLFISGCGIHISSDPVKVEPIEVNHKVLIDLDALEAHYLAVCQAQYDPADADYAAKVSLCQAQKVSEFINLLEQVTK